MGTKFKLKNKTVFGLTLLELAEMVAIAKKHEVVVTLPKIKPSLDDTLASLRKCDFRVFELALENRFAKTLLAKKLGLTSCFKKELAKKLAAIRYQNRQKKLANQ